MSRERRLCRLGDYRWSLVKFVDGLERFISLYVIPSWCHISQCNKVIKLLKFWISLSIFLQSCHPFTSTIDLSIKLSSLHLHDPYFFIIPNKLLIINCKSPKHPPPELSDLREEQARAWIETPKMKITSRKSLTNYDLKKVYH